MEAGLVQSRYSAHMKCLDLIGSQAKVLDIGCNNGYLCRELKKRGCFVVGVEIDAGLAREARKHCDEVYTADAEDLELAYSNYFDAVLVADVLGCFRNPAAALNKFKGCLKEDGYLVLSIPNIANWSIRLSLLFGNFNYQEKGILYSGYMRHFTAKSIRSLLEEAGLKIEKFDITSNLKGFTRFGFIRFLAGMAKNLFASQFIIKAAKAARK